MFDLFDQFHFASPGFLVLLATLPLLVMLSLKSLSGLGPIRKWIAIVARCAVVALLIFALAGLETVRENDDLTVMFVLDRSNSIPNASQDESFEFTRAAGTKMRRDDRLGVIVFGGAPTVDQLPQRKGTPLDDTLDESGLKLERLSPPLRPDQTNIAASLRMALAMFTDFTARRVVLLTDGNENVGNALTELEQFAAAGIPIDVLPLEYAHDNEVVFERLTTPPTAATRETIKLQMVLRSQKNTTGRIIVEQNGEALDLDPDPQQVGFPVQLQPGVQRIDDIAIRLREAGSHRFSAKFVPDDLTRDTIAGNNEGRSFTIVSGQRRILVLSQSSAVNDGAEWESARLFVTALQNEQLVCDLRVAGDTPITPEALLEYSAVVLANVPADLLSAEEREGLAVYVRVLGGGLVMLGGDASFGAGGWMDSPVEDVMPVSFDVKNKKQIPRGALVLTMHACEIPQGNYWGERVAVEAVKALSRLDYIGVLSWQWQNVDRGYWDVPLQLATDKNAIIARLKQMNMGDMPDLDPVMRPGVEELVNLGSKAAAKHMIVISDFDPAPPRADLIATMKQHNISCSTVAIGWGGHPIDTALAQRIARETGGKYYTTADYSQLPRIFIKEASIVRRSLINENPFTPRLVNTLSTLVEGLDTGIPELGGYVVTTPKPLATIPIVRKTDEGADPVLAHWQVGLGKSIAFTSGMWNRWGTRWAAWDGYGKFWAQAIRWVSRQSPASAFDVQTSVQGGLGRIRIDALDKDAAAINFMNIDGVLVRPDKSVAPVELTQTGPGTYEGTFDADVPGSYVMNVNYRMGQGAEATRGMLQTGLSVAFSPEYRELRDNRALLAALAEESGGRLLAPRDTQAIFTTDELPPAEARQSIWQTLVTWMLALFLLDVAIRRIALNPIEMARNVRHFIREMGTTHATADQSAAVLSTLKGKRAETRSEHEPQQRPRASAKYDPQREIDRSNEDLADALGGASENDKPVVARPPRKKSSASGEADFTSRLLKAKQRARGKLRPDESDDSSEKK